MVGQLYRVRVHSPRVLSPLSRVRVFYLRQPRRVRRISVRSALGFACQHGRFALSTLQLRLGSARFGL